MKIQYASDLHLEFQDNRRFLRQNPLQVTGEVLVLAGDVGYLNDMNLPEFNLWKWAAENYRQVLMVPGNHEYYNWGDVLEYGDGGWRRMFRDNVGYCHNQVVRVDDTDFILSTLWSSINPTDAYYVFRGMNDFRQIMYGDHRFNIDDFVAEYHKCLLFIKRSVEESTAEKIVVVTHHLPTCAVVAEQHRGSVLNSAFATELGDFIAASRINAWIYGHSHTNIDAVIGGTQVISNQMGYVFCGEHICGFDRGKCVEV